MLITPITQSPTSPLDLDEKFWDYFNGNMEVITNVTEHSVVPPSGQGFVVGMYGVLFATGAVGNVAVFTSLVRSRRRKSRVNLLMTHLAVADLIVTFFVIPLEVSTVVALHGFQKLCKYLC